jgi:myo-inositol-1(or 4)-monophosphatase
VPHFSISIAVEEKSRRRHRDHQGLVYQPLTDDSYWAEKGRGAWLQDARLRVSARRDLTESLIGTESRIAARAIQTTGPRSTRR